MEQIMKRIGATGIGQLARPCSPIPGGTPCRDVEALFVADPLVGAVAVRRGDGAVVALMRDRFFADMVGPLGYGRALHHARPVERLAPDEPLVLPATMGVAEAEQAALARMAGRRYDDLVVALADGGFGLLPVADLLAELSRLYAHQALHDSLTGLANRTQFMLRLRQHADGGAPDEAVAAVLFLDVDRFKSLNDSLGHDAGDELLVELADRLRRVVRPGDLVARYAGDEFGVLLVGDAARAPGAPEAVAERLMHALQTPVRIQGRDVLVSVSVGIVGVDDPGPHDPEELMRSADLAMYQAKSAGGGRYARYTAGMAAALAGELDLEIGLRSALAAGELTLRYQPKVLTEGQEVVEVEALIRWERPGIGTLSPATFIPVAERTGLIISIGRWVLREACRQAAAWHAAFPDRRPLIMAVNVSARQLSSQGLLNDVADALAESGLPPACLCLEVTESAVATDPDAARAVLNRLRTLGVRVAIDDFGTGHSSLARLTSLPADELKIDRAFVSKLGRGSADEAIVAHIIELARTCGMTVTAEGVETNEQLLTLNDMRCDLVQGFLTGRPLTADGLGLVLDSQARQAAAGTRGVRSVRR